MTLPRPADADDDARLVALCQQGDEVAMQRLYERHGGRLFGLAYRLTSSASDAQDVVQDAFLKAWRALPRFRGDASFGTWIYRIALNQCRDVVRRRKPTAEEVEGVAPAGSGDALARRRLEGALAQLSEGYREVLVMHDVLDMNHPDIAAVLGIEVGTSKSQLHKARARMRVLLQAGAAEETGS